MITPEQIQHEYEILNFFLKSEIPTEYAEIQKIKYMHLVNNMLCEMLQELVNLNNYETYRKIAEIEIRINKIKMRCKI